MLCRFDSFLHVCACSEVCSVYKCVTVRLLRHPMLSRSLADYNTSVRDLSTNDWQVAAARFRTDYINNRQVVAPRFRADYTNKWQVAAPSFMTDYTNN